MENPTTKWTTLNITITPTLLDLPFPILAEILSRLPLKSIFNCRLTCKTFLNITSEPHFSNLMVSARQSPTLLFRGADLRGHTITAHVLPGSKQEQETFDYNLDDYVFDFQPGVHFPAGYLVFLDSCNGLLCFIERCLSRQVIYICNPILRQYVALPERTSDDKFFSAYGFGYSHVAKEYKVVRFCTYYYQSKTEVEVLTLGKNTWRHLGGVPYHPVRGFSAMFNLNGALHCLSHNDMSIYTFDLARERIQYIPLPISADLLTLDIKLQALGSFLSIVVKNKYGYGSHRFEIWLMKEYGVVESWTRLRASKRFFILEPLTYWNGGEILFAEYKSTFFSYDPRTKILKECKRDRKCLVEAFAYSYHPCFLTLEDVFKKEQSREVVKLMPLK